MGVRFSQDSICDQFQNGNRHCELIDSLQICHFGKAKLYRNTITNQKFFIHNYDVLCQGHKVTPTTERLMNFNNQCPYLMHIWKIETPNDYEENQSESQHSVQVRVYFQVLNVTLKQLLMSRTVPFPESQVCKILSCLLNAEKYLNDAESYHGDIAPQFIFFDDSSASSRYKIYDSAYFDSKNTGYYRAQTHKTLCAPEILANINDNRTFPVYNQYVSDIFSIGLVILYCTTLIDPLEAYQAKEKQIDFYVLENLIRITIRNGYSQNLVECISSCIQTKNRPTATEILEKNPFLLTQFWEDAKYSLKRNN